jgi:hypothetical protein
MIERNFSESLYNYLVASQIISITSLMIYLRYEYFEKGCFSLKCFVSEKTLSGTKLVKFDVVITVVLIIGFTIHYFRILIRVYLQNWFGFKDYLNESRIEYPKELNRLLKSGFGSGYDFYMNRLGMNKGEYLIHNL